VPKDKSVKHVTLAFALFVNLVACGGSDKATSKAAGGSLAASGRSATEVPEGGATAGGQTDQGGGGGGESVAGSSVGGSQLGIAGNIGTGGIVPSGGASSSATTGGAPGTNPSSNPIGRFAAMVAPSSGESFVAPATLRLIAVGRDPNVYTNSPSDGLGGNAAKVQFFVDDTLALEVDGAHAEYWVFKGFVTGIGAGRHQIRARAIYVSPDLVLDSPPMVIDVADAPAYASVIDLTADVVLTGATGYELRGTSTGRIRLNGHGYRIISSSNATGPLSLQFVDVFDLGPSSDPTKSAADVTTTGAVTIEDCRFDTSSTLKLGIAGSTAASIRRNLLRSNMRMPLGQYPDTYSAAGASYPVLSLSGGSGVLAGNNIGAGYVEVENAKGWIVGGDSDADSNVLIGPRVGLSPKGSVELRRNYSHHVYFGGWSQGCNFELGGSAAVTAEHNVVYGSSWPVRGVGGQFRYNLVLDAGHQWLWADTSGGNIHHNVFVGGDADIGGLYVLYEPTNVSITNNTIDGLSKLGLAVKMSSGTVTMTSNLFYRVPTPGISVEGGTLNADYNLFFGSTTSYSDGRSPPAHDLAKDPLLSDPPNAVFDLDESAIWQRRLSVREVLARYRARYLPATGSPVIDAGDPAGGTGNDIGAVGNGAVNANDKFGTLE
jgi:hypothetical protein